MSWFWRGVLKQGAYAAASQPQWGPNDGTGGESTYLALEDVPQPPFSRAWAPTVLAAWTLAPILLWTNGFTIPEASANVPLNRGWVEGVRQSWEPQDYPRQARRFVAQGAVAATGQPFNGSLNELISSWQGVDPPPFQKRLGQVISAVAVDSPIPGHRPWAKIVFNSWTQAPVLVWQNSSLAQAGVAADQPVFSRAWWQSVSQWQPETWAAQARETLPQGAFYDPPFGARKQSFDAWRAETWPSQAKAAPPQAAPAVDNPPFGARRQSLEAWRVEGWVSQIREGLPQAAIADNPPFGQERPAAIWRSWDPEPWLMPERVFQVPAVAAVDAPPVGYRPSARIALSSWGQAPALIWQSGFLAQEGPASPVDPPPIRRSPSLRIALSSWAQAPILIWQNGFVAQDGPPPQADNPPFGKRSWLAGNIGSWEQVLIPHWGSAGTQSPVDEPPYGKRSWLPVIRLWEPEWAAPQALERAPQGTAAAVNNPPFGVRAWLLNVREAWAPTPYTPQVLERLAQAGAAVIDQPFVRSWPNGTLASWAQDWAAQRTRFLAQGAPVDNPPFGLRSWLNAAVASWGQDWAWQRRLVLAQPFVAAADNPPFGLRSWAPSVRETWEPATHKPQAQTHLAQAAIADQPPGLDPWFAGVLESWQPAWPRTQEKRCVVQGAVVNNPPFGAKPWVMRVVQAWQPGPPDIGAPRAYRLAVPPTPEIEFPSAARTYHILAEDRLYLVQAEDRVYLIVLEDRDLEI